MFYTSMVEVPAAGCIGAARARQCHVALARPFCKPNVRTQSRARHEAFQRALHRELSPPPIHQCHTRVPPNRPTAPQNAHRSRRSRALVPSVPNEHTGAGRGWGGPTLRLARSPQHSGAPTHSEGRLGLALALGGSVRSVRAGSRAPCPRRADPLAAPRRGTSSRWSPPG